MNGYFQIDIRSDGAFLIVHQPTGEDDEHVRVDEVCAYLSDIGVKTIDKDVIYEILSGSDEVCEGRISVLFREEQAARIAIDVSEDKMKAFGKIFPPSVGGPKLNVEDLMDQISRAKVRFGVLEEAIKEAVEKEAYNTEFVIAEGKEPVQGVDGRIEYYFETEKNLAPRLNEDGTVDYHDLNMISHISEGELLAKLYPDDPGENGMNVMGEVLRPKKVKKVKLAYGNNIEINEDKTELRSMVTGHASLTNGKVFVSNVYQVPADVDTTTGDIDFEGSVEIKGNVNSGFSVRSGGDITIGGVVEGAKLEAKGKIVIANGIHGMGRANIYAGGSIAAKFIENATVYSDESVNADSILHSNVYALYDVRVKGKKGFIVGGNIQAGVSIETQTLGSAMGATTVVEVGVNPRERARVTELQMLIKRTNEEIAKIEPTITAAGKKIGLGEKFPPEKMQIIQQLSRRYQTLKSELKEYEEEFSQFKTDPEANRRAQVEVKGDAFPGVSVIISDVSKTLAEKRSGCKFVRQDGDIKII